MFDLAGRKVLRRRTTSPRDYAASIAGMAGPVAVAETAPGVRAGVGVGIHHCKHLIAKRSAPPGRDSAKDKRRRAFIPRGVMSPKGDKATILPATGPVENADSTGPNGRPLDRDPAEALGREMGVENDADCPPCPR